MAMLSRTEASRPWDDEALKALPSLSGQEHEGPNPFGPYAADDPRAKANSDRWKFWHYDRGRTPSPPDDGPADPMELFEDVLAARTSDYVWPWTETEGPEGSVFLPSVANLPPSSMARLEQEKEWSAGAQEMHRNQQTIKLDAKADGGYRVVRPEDPEEIPKFEDSDGSTLRRGD